MPVCRDMEKYGEEDPSSTATSLQAELIQKAVLSSRCHAHKEEHTEAAYEYM